MRSADCGKRWYDCPYLGQRFPRVDQRTTLSTVLWRVDCPTARSRSICSEQRRQARYTTGFCSRDGTVRSIEATKSSFPQECTNLLIEGEQRRSVELKVGQYPGWQKLGQPAPVLRLPPVRRGRQPMTNKQPAALGLHLLSLTAPVPGPLLLFVGVADGEQTLSSEMRDANRAKCVGHSHRYHLHGDFHTVKGIGWTLSGSAPW